MPHAIFTELVLYDEEHSNDWRLRIRVDRNGKLHVEVDWGSDDVGTMTFSPEDAQALIEFLGPRVASGE